jgi:Cdc6-like AAA superfamily ATPase
MQHVNNQIGIQERNSVPRSIKEDDIKSFLHELMKKSTPWHSMKLVVLGNGRIGKTTLLHMMLQLLKTSDNNNDNNNFNEVCGVNIERKHITII